MEFKKILKENPRYIFKYWLTIPVIYPLIIPIVLLDVCLEIYHRICFPIYGLPYIKRSSYIRIDRQKLTYLNWMEKFNCAYCGYANGVLHYVSRIAGETEKYWCGIMHDKYDGFKPPPHHKNFLPYGDEQALRKLIDK